jgi:hypothetical protein
VDGRDRFVKELSEKDLNALINLTQGAVNTIEDIIKNNTYEGITEKYAINNLKYYKRLKSKLEDIKNELNSNQI